ncbi:MAG: UTP--glucose-1-phosphate uridylyltransferase [Acidobacteriota bacterium]|nr:MAG: UTP--glucose-1-phosphate uridylyltransferase [Acidobacteriota bacterium]
MSIDIAVVPVAGLGTRLLPATKSQPKEMLPVAKKPVVQYVVEELEGNGIKQILLVTGRSKTSIENHFDFDHELTRHLRETGKEELLPELEYERMRLQFFFTRQRKQKGLGDAIMCGQHYTQDQPFVVALGDSILGLNGSARVVQKMIEAYETQRPACVIATEEVPIESVSSYGVVAPASDDEVYSIVDLVEKPSVEEAPSNQVIAARYVFSPAIYQALAETKPGKQHEIQLTDAIKLLLDSGEKIMGVRVSPAEKRYDIGSFQSYFEAFVDFALADKELGSEFEEYLRRKFCGDH